MDWSIEMDPKFDIAINLNKNKKLFSAKQLFEVLPNKEYKLGLFLM